MGGAVAIGAFGLQHELASAVAFELLAANAAAGDGAAQTLELHAIHARYSVLLANHA